MAREFSRGDRLATQIQRELSLILQRETSDPRLGHITINAVKMVHDLSTATVYFSELVQHDTGGKDSLAALTKAAPFLRYKLGSQLRVRNVPDIKFVYDESVERGNRIEAILKDIDQQKPEPSA